MSKSRKLREKKLRARLNSVQVKYAALRNRVGHDDEVLARYLGGLTLFGLAVLKTIEGHHRSELFLMAVIDGAIAGGFIEWHEPIKRWRMTHTVKEQFSEDQLSRGFDPASEGTAAASGDTRRKANLADGVSKQAQLAALANGILPTG